MRRVILDLRSAIAIVSTIGLGLWWHDLSERRANRQSIGYWDYVRLGQARMTDPVYRMGRMIELQCNVTADFNITREELKQIVKLHKELKNKLERIEADAMQICREWEKHKNENESLRTPPDR